MYVIQGGFSRKAPVTTFLRAKLTADRTYYVRTDGNNNNTGLVDSSGGAFLTIQRAMDVIVEKLDVAGFTVTISAQNTTWTTGIVVNSWVGGGMVILDVNTGSITVTGGKCIDVAEPLSGIFQFKNVTLSTITSGNCVEVNANAIVWGTTGVIFGATASGHLTGQAQGAAIAMLNDYTISGGGSTHYYMTFNAGLFSGGAVTVSGTPAFSQGFAVADTLSLIMSLGSYTGAATGKRYDVSVNAVIQTFGGGANFFPGDVAGTTATGGQYG